MTWRLWLTSAVLATGIGLSPNAFGAGSADLSPQQKRTTDCMMSVLRAIPEVSKPELNVSRVSRLHIVLSYAYRRRSGAVEVNRVEITNLVSPARSHVLALNGLAGAVSDLNDVDLGMLRIADLWRSRCISDLSVLTV